MYNPITRMVAAPFPLVLVAPAVGLDILVKKFGRGRDGWLSAVGGIAFVALMLAAHWPLGEFLLSPYARNPVFAADQWGYGEIVDATRRQFWNVDSDPVTLPALAVAAVIAATTIRIGLWMGDWLLRVRR